ncbi:MAG: beta-galactosidase [Thermoprotei archaeon]
MKAYGYNTVELNVPWGAVEVGPGAFNFTLLDSYAAYTERLNLSVIFLLFYGVNNPIPEFLVKNGEMEVNPKWQDEPNSPPYLSWWNATDRSYFIGFVKAVISRYNSYPNVRGYLINYGWLDDDWGPPVNGLPMGYSVSDLREYRNYLQSQYGTIQNLDRAWNASFSSFSEVTLPLPFTEYWPYFQQFRIWSINETYSEIYATARSMTRKGIFLYWGGSPSDVYGLQLPEIYFQIAKRYNVTIILDDADVTAYASLFSNFARAYGVNLMMEWTPNSGGLSDRAYYGHYLSHWALAFPSFEGEDYFVFSRAGGAWSTFSLNAMAVQLYSLINDSYKYPPPRVALLYFTLPGYSQEQASVDQAEVAGIPTQSFNSPSPYFAYDVITPTEIEEGLVNLSKYEYLVPLAPLSYAPASVMREIRAWQVNGGKVVNSALLLPQSLDFLKANGEQMVSGLYVFPLVYGHNSGWLIVNNWNGPSGSVNLSLNLTALGIRANRALVINDGQVEDLPDLSLDFHAEGTYFVYLFKGQQSSVSPWLGPVNYEYNATCNATSIYFRGSGSGKLILTLSSESYAPGLIYSVVGASHLTVHGNFTSYMTVPGLSPGNYDLTAYLFNGSRYSNYSRAFAVKGVQKTTTFPYHALLILVILVIVTLATVFGVRRHSKLFRNSRICIWLDFQKGRRLANRHAEKAVARINFNDFSE